MVRCFQIRLNLNRIHTYLTYRISLFRSFALSIIPVYSSCENPPIAHKVIEQVGIPDSAQENDDDCKDDLGSQRQFLFQEQEKRSQDEQVQPGQRELQPAAAEILQDQEQRL